MSLEQKRMKQRDKEKGIEIGEILQRLSDCYRSVGM